MAYISIRGHNDKLTKRETLQAIDIYGKHLMGRLYKHISIEVEFLHSLGMWGRCGIVDIHRGKCRDFGIEVNSDLCKRNQLITIAHEMVHLKQFARGEFMDLGEDRYRWKSRVMRLTEARYFEFPWEVEAYALERKLYQLYKDNV